jgi:hypothetical protein
VTGAALTTGTGNTRACAIRPAHVQVWFGACRGQLRAGHGLPLPEQAVDNQLQRHRRKRKEIQAAVCLQGMPTCAACEGCTLDMVGGPASPTLHSTGNFSVWCVCGDMLPVHATPNKLPRPSRSTAEAQRTLQPRCAQIRSVVLRPCLSERSPPLTLSNTAQQPNAFVKQCGIHIFLS